MNYFQDLLASYSKLKKRELKISLFSYLEEGEEAAEQRDPMAVQKANDAIKKGVLSNSKDAAVSVQCFDRQLKFWKSTSGKNQGMVHVDAGLLGSMIQVIGDGSGNPIEGKAYAALINLFSGKKVEGGKSKSDTPPELMPIPSPLKQQGNSTPNTEALISGYQDNCLKAEKMGGDEGFGAEAASYARGFAMQSLERKLSETTSVKLTEDGPQEIPVDADLIEGAAASAKFVSDLGVAGSITKEDCGKIKERVAKSGRKIVYLHANDATRGIAITPSPMDKFFMSNIEQKCGATAFGQVTTKSGADQSSQNDFLGKSVENLAALIPLFEMTTKMEPGKEKNALQVWQKSKLEYVFTKSIQLSQAAYAWATAQKDSGVDIPAHLKEKFILEAGEIFSSPRMMQQILSRISRLGHPIRRKYKPDMVIPTGLEKGYGVKGDVAYAYMGDDAEARASKNGARPKAMTLSQLFDITNEDFKDIIPEYIKAQGLDPTKLSGDTKIFVVAVGMKTYKDVAAVKYGESESVDNQLNFLQGNYKPEFRDQCIAEVIPPPKNEADLPLWQAKVDGVQKYRRDVLKIDKLVKSLIPDADSFITASDGKRTPVDPQQAVTLIHKKLSSTLSYDAQTNSEFLKIVTDDDGNMLKMDDPSTRARVSEQISRLLVTARLNKDMNSTNPKTRYNARASEMIMMFGIGGEHGDGVSDIRDVTKNQSFTLSHNDPLRKCVQGFMAEPPTWELKQNAYGCSYYNPETSERISVNREGAGTGKSRSTRTVVKVNRAAILGSNKLTDKQSGLTISGKEDSEVEGMGEAIDAYLFGQKTFLEEFLRVSQLNQQE